MMPQVPPATHIQVTKHTYNGKRWNAAQHSKDEEKWNAAYHSKNEEKLKAHLYARTLIKIEKTYALVKKTNHNNKLIVIII